MNVLPILVTGLLFLASTYMGMSLVRKLIQLREARHELKQGSAGFLRSMAGWTFIVFWAMTVLLCAAVLGDWQMSGDFHGALERGSQRTKELFRIVMALVGT